MTGRSACICNDMGRAATSFEPAQGVLPLVGVFGAFPTLAGRACALKMGAIVLLTAMVAAMAVPEHPIQAVQPVERSSLPVHHAVAGVGTLAETLEVYYTPLPSTLVTRNLGFGMAYHMAIVYTDRTGTSYGASSGPSDLAAAQTPDNALQALVALASDSASRFGTLVSDPKNDTPFRIGRDGDYYTRGDDGGTYPHALMMKGQDLSQQWTKILQTYVLVGDQHLPYVPTTQNSNSLAGVALKRIGLRQAFSSSTVFAPGVFTELPLPPVKGAAPAASDPASPLRTGPAMVATVGRPYDSVSSAVEIPSGSSQSFR